MSSKIERHFLFGRRSLFFFLVCFSSKGEEAHPATFAVTAPTLPIDMAVPHTTTIEDTQTETAIEEETMVRPEEEDPHRLATIPTIETEAIDTAEGGLLHLDLVVVHPEEEDAA